MTAPAEPNPVERALISAARYNSTGLNPQFRDELNDRMSMVMDATALLQTVLENAAAHDVELSYQHLYGSVKLIARELIIVDELLDALATTIQAIPEFHRALLHY